MRPLRALLSAMALMLAAPVHASPANWTEPVAPFHVIDNVYYVGSAGISAWIIKTPAGLILLDAGMPEYAPQVEANIRALGFKLSDVKIILNTHAHFDHSGGLARLKADTGARFYAAQADVYALERGVYAGSEDEHGYDAPPIKVDRALRPDEKVTLGGVTLTAFHTPGHTAGCTSWLLPLREAGRAHQAIFFCSASVAANRLAPNPQYPGIVADYRRTFARLKTVKADVMLGAHAEFFDLAGKRARLGKPGPNPFIVPGEINRLGAKMEADFRKALLEQTAKSR